MLTQTRILRTLMVLLLAGAALALTLHLSARHRTPIRTADTAAVAAATNDFGFRLYARLAKSDGKQNLFISPLSLELALAMTCNGAHGSTRQAMAKTLGLAGLTPAQVNARYSTLADLICNADPDNARVQLANSLWLSQKKTFQANFLKRNKDAYQAELATVDFTDPRTVTRVNDWVSAHTNKMIPSIMQSGDFDSLTVLALVNALHFKGIWTQAFEGEST